VGTGIMMCSCLDLYCCAIAKIDLTCEATQSWVKLIVVDPRSGKVARIELVGH